MGKTEDELLEEWLEYYRELGETEQGTGGIAMEYQEFVMTMQMAGATLSNEQISELAAEAHEKFGIDKDAFMLLLLSGREDFRNWIYEQASEKLKKDLRSEYIQTAKNVYGERLRDKRFRRGISENIQETTHIHL